MHKRNFLPRYKIHQTLKDGEFIYFFYKKIRGNGKEREVLLVDFGEGQERDALSELEGKANDGKFPHISHSDVTFLRRFIGGPEQVPYH